MADKVRVRQIVSRKESPVDTSDSAENAAFFAAATAEVAVSESPATAAEKKDAKTIVQGFLAEQDKPLSVQEIVEKTQLPAAEVAAALDQLVSSGAVTKTWLDWSYVFYWSK